VTRKKTPAPPPVEAKTEPEPVLGTVALVDAEGNEADFDLLDLFEVVFEDAASQESTGVYALLCQVDPTAAPDQRAILLMRAIEADNNQGLTQLVPIDTDEEYLAVREAYGALIAANAAADPDPAEEAA
jgi:uncharacterized protein YrzB (UPF0473 family)